VGQDKFAFNGVSVVGQSVGSEGTTLTLNDGSTVLLANLTSPPDFMKSAGPAQQKLTTSGNKVTGGAAPIVVTDDAGQNTVIGGSGGLTLQATGAGDLVRTASGARDQINLQLGGTVQSGGTDTISALGNSSILARGNASVTAGSGVMRFTGAGGASTLSGGSGTLIVFAGGGNITLAGGSGNLRFVGGSGSTSITGGSGSDTVNFGAGHATVSASTGADLYRVTEGVGGGSDLIVGFRAGTDHIDLRGYSQPPTETLAGGTLTLGLSDGTTIALADVTHLASNSILVI
jgi:Ca2+-binding RTX toxin-like protein